MASLVVFLFLTLAIQQCFAADDSALIDAAPPDEVVLPSLGDNVTPSYDEESATFNGIEPYDTTGGDLAGSGADERLIDRITDPTSWLMDFRFRQRWNWPESAADPDTQEFQFRPTIPYLAWDRVNILRISVPYDLQDADGAGLGNIQGFNLVVFDESWGRWGVGPSVRVLSDPEPNENPFQAGPAAGAVTKNKHWSVGVLMQNFLGDADSETTIQPILAYKFNEKWAVGIGESEFRYDWDEAMWTQLPAGVQLDYIADLGGQKIQFFVNPQYNFQRDASNSGWTVFVGMTLLVPRA